MGRVRYLGVLVTAGLLSLGVVVPLYSAEAEAHGDQGSTVSAHAEEGHASGPVEFKADLAIYTLVVFVILVWVLSRIAWKPMLDAAQAREAAIGQAVEQAERARAEAEALLRQHRERLAKAEDEVRQILDRAKAEAERLHQEILSKAHQETEQLKERAREEIEQAKDEALRDLFEKAAELVVSAMGRLLPRVLGPEQQRELANQVLDELGAEASRKEG